MSDNSGALPEWGLRLMRRLTGGHFRRRWQVVERGRSHVPSDGPVILASNHIGWLDGPLLFATSPRAAHAMVKEEEFAGKTGRLLRFVGQIKVARDRTDAGALRQAIGALSAQQCVLIYPEGHRGDGEFRVFKGGVAYLALVTGAPVVPVAVFGTRRPGEPSSARPPRGARLDIVYGEPIQFPMQPWPRDRGMIEGVGEQILEHLRDHLSWSKDVLNRTLPGPLPTGTPDV